MYVHTYMFGKVAARFGTTALAAIGPRKSRLVVTTLYRMRLEEESEQMRTER